ncbi:hypothetical protein WOLCODRAFT_155947 [Wolfiporia cocos MD-104 SS10]|uniref:Uncharacterized protein n=1 Tax=Wolfiporia cocos (strain MD-104) TaxID=742152 RepID=A0A2H3J0N7_WOLCO|nr:hypothetical protein WOLCODRAFT_155947 [Wolfiporia cocos MD-104 SS10]
MTWTSPILIESIQADVREYARHIMNRRDSSSPLRDPPSAEELATYSRSGILDMTIDTFRVDFNGGAKSRWNAVAAEVFAEGFIASGWYECRDQERIQDAFMAHLKCLKSRYAEQQRGDDQDSPQKMHQRANNARNRRRISEHGHALDTLNRMALALPRNWKFIIGKRAFVALAAMLHNPAACKCDNPVINGQRKHRMPYASFTIIGKRIIDAGLRVLGLKPRNLTHHLGLGDRSDPGEPVDFGDAFKPWQQFEETDEWTDKKIVETEQKEQKERALAQHKSQAHTAPARQSERIREQQSVTSTSTSTSADRWTRNKHQTPYNPKQPRTVQHDVERSPLVIFMPPLQHPHAHGLGNGSKGRRDVLVDEGNQSSDLSSLED